MNKPFKDMTPTEQAEQRRLWALEEEAERLKTRVQAKAAICNLESLNEVIRDFLRAHEDNPDWDGPEAHSNWTLDLGSSGSETIVLHYHGWDGCHCHGRQTEETATIPVEDLFAENLEEVGARFRARKEQKAREEREAQERLQRRMEAEQKAAQEKADREEYARLQAKFAKAGQ